MQRALCGSMEHLRVLIRLGGMMVNQTTPMGTKAVCMRITMLRCITWQTICPALNNILPCARSHCLFDIDVNQAIFHFTKHSILAKLFSRDAKYAVTYHNCDSLFCHSVKFACKQLHAGQFVVIASKRQREIAFSVAPFMNRTFIILVLLPFRRNELQLQLALTHEEVALMASQWQLV